MAAARIKEAFWDDCQIDGCPPVAGLDKEKIEEQCFIAQGMGAWDEMMAAGGLTGVSCTGPRLYLARVLTKPL